MKLIKWLIKLWKKFKRRLLIARASVKMEAAVNKQINGRKALRADVNAFLKEYFGINANSKYIPKDFKNKEEVKTAVCAKFETRMNNLNIKFEHLFS